MSEVYIVTEVGFEYDDNYYRLPENNSVELKNVFSTHAAAIVYKNELEAKFIEGFRLGDFYETYETDISQNRLKMYGLDYDSTFKEAKDVMPENEFQKLMQDLGIYKVVKMTVRD